MYSIWTPSSKLKVIVVVFIVISATEIRYNAQILPSDCESNEKKFTCREKSSQGFSKDITLELSTDGLYFT